MFIFIKTKCFPTIYEHHAVQFIQRLWTKKNDLWFPLVFNKCLVFFLSAGFYGHPGNFYQTQRNFTFFSCKVAVNYYFLIYKCFMRKNLSVRCYHYSLIFEECTPIRFMLFTTSISKFPPKNIFCCKIWTKHGKI